MIPETVTERQEVKRTLAWQPALSIIVPAFNEGKLIGQVVDELSALARVNNWQVIVVDDGSVDDTADQVRMRVDGTHVHLLQHPYNRGYGAALKTGIREAAADLIATMDSDGQHDPNDLVRLLPLAEQHQLVVGERTNQRHSPLWRRPGKWVLGLLANYLSGRRIPDLNSGMRLVQANVIKKYLHLFPAGFSFSTTCTMALTNRGYNVAYVPIEARPRPTASKSTVSLSTGFDTLVLILRLATLFQPLRLFIPASAFFMALGTLWGLPFLLLLRGVSVGALLFLMTGLLLFFFGLLVDQVAQLRLEKYE